jgi:hypothetical protein
VLLGITTAPIQTAFAGVTDIERSALDFRSGLLGVRSLERAVEHRQDEHEDVHRR